MNWIITSGLGFAGFAALALAQKKHHRVVFADNTSHALAGLPYLPVGWALVAAALVVAVTGHQTGYGLVVLSAALMVSGWGMSLAITYRPRLAPWAIALGSFLAAAAGLALATIA
jgi:hypothetical protein